MPLDFSLRIYSQGRDGGWSYEDYLQLPVSRPCIILFHLNHEEARAEAEELTEGIRKVLGDLKASSSAVRGWGDWHDLDDRGANRLHVVVCKGYQQANLEPAVLEQVRIDDRVWVLPVVNISDKDKVHAILGEELGKRNVAFWQESITELSLTLLARAGVTTMDRRVFISYRRTDTSPMADQLFDALTRRNFSVFLDRVSVEPGVDFQASLFEQLADKSMVVLLNSKTFPNSRWTMEEIRFARERRLSLLVLRLPDALDRLGASDSEELPLQDSDVDFVEVPGFDVKQASLVPTTLEKFLRRVQLQHDSELIGRVVDMRSRVMEAAAFAGKKASYGQRIAITSIPSKQDFTVTVEVCYLDTKVSEQYTIYPSAYPPAVPELFDASRSTRTTAKKRLVVGHITSMLPFRSSQLDWVVGGRNVGYYDIDAISLVFDLMGAGKL